MMRIFIDDKEAVLKLGSSFDYVRENRMFTDSDDYTFDISFPLRDCPQNVDIFGVLYRKDIDIDTYAFDARIVDRDVDLHGIFVITDIDDVEVKCQFLSGRSRDNFSNPLDSIYLNEMTLYTLHDVPGTDPEYYWQINNSFEGDFTFLCLPWVNNETGIIQNRVKYDSENDAYEYILPDSEASWDDYSPSRQQIYLSHLIRLICNAIGFDIDLSFITDNNYLKYLVVCNALPYAWEVRELARALPHWTVREFFLELEKLLCCTFDFDFKHQTISVRYDKDILSSAAVVINDVLDDYTEQYELESSKVVGKSRVVANSSYADNGSRAWKYWCCPALMKRLNRLSMGKNFTSMTDLKDWVQHQRLLGNYKYYGANRMYHCRANGKDFMLCNMETIYDRTAQQYFHRMRLFHANIFGDNILDEEGDTVELRIVPVGIDEVIEDWGSKNYDCMFLNFGSYDEWEGVERDGFEVDTEDNSQSQRIHGSTTFERFTELKPYFQDLLDEGVSQSIPEYYSQLYIGFWNPDTMFKRGTIPYPFVDNDVFYQDMSYKHVDDNFSLRLDDGVMKTLASNYAVDGKTTYQFKFLTDELLDPQRVYIIHGKRYLCKKLTYSFREEGRSKLVKGEFYRIDE